MGTVALIPLVHTIDLRYAYKSLTSCSLLRQLVCGISSRGIREVAWNRRDLTSSVQTQVYNSHDGLIDSSNYDIQQSGGEDSIEYFNLVVQKINIISTPISCAIRVFPKYRSAYWQKLQQALHFAIRVFPMLYRFHSTYLILDTIEKSRFLLCFLFANMP